ncbi:copper resistance protein CopC [Knoellia locipacati]|uniref:copper resistance CopC family protein n=1 Tax=Knoellia locipacati TaxID=882824 RepID=UPI00384E8800
MRLPIRGLSLLVLTTLLGLLAGVVPASAHSRLLSISPADGASVPGSPAEVVLTFNEEVNPEFVTVRVTDGEGTAVAGDDATAEGAVVKVPVTDPIPAGSYKVAYRVVSADAHPISGSTSFTVEGNPESSSTATGASPSASSAAPSASGSPSSTALPDGSTGGDEPASAGTPVAVWIAVFAALVGAVAATLYAVRKDHTTG